MGMTSAVAGRLRRESGVLAALLMTAAAGWWWSVRMADGMSSPGMAMDGMAPSMGMSFGAFLVGWAAMMAAMMLPAITPVVRLYSHAARRGTVAPVPVFVAGYMLVWTAIGVPAYWAWDALREPLMAADPWVGRLAGGTFVLAAVYQLTPLKAVCLRHCRTPMSFFLHLRGDLRRPGVALRAGVQHGSYCFGCCWALMVVLVAMGTMHLGWMVAFAVLIAVEKVVPEGDRVGRALGLGLAALGAALLLHPDFLVALR